MKPLRSITIREAPARVSMRSRRAFTLVEMLMTVAMIALLIALLLPSLGKAREMSRRMVCLSNLHQQQTAVVSFGVENARRLPH